MRVSAIVLAGGLGLRMGPDTEPKQFGRLLGRPLILWCLDAFEKVGWVEEVVVVSHGDHVERVRELVEAHSLTKVTTIAPGGVTRQESSFNGLLSLADPPPDLVLIHDAARPFISEDLLREVREAATEHGAATPGIPLADTLVEVEDDVLTRTIPRERLFRVQTPQGFRFDLIMKAHREAVARGVTGATDDAQLVMALGHRVRLVPGSLANIKITDPWDWKIAGEFASIRRAFEGFSP